jgi:hypothetical protein
MPGQVEIVGSDGQPVQKLPPVTRVNLDDASGGEAEPAATAAPRTVDPPTDTTAAAPKQSRRGRPVGSRNTKPRTPRTAGLTPPSTEDAPVALGRFTVECQFAYVQPGVASLVFNRKTTVSAESIEQLPQIYAKLMGEWSQDIARQVRDLTA